MPKAVPTCHSLVTVSAPEVLFVRRGIAAAALSATRDAVGRSYETTSGLSPDERLANPTACPLLRERICSVYAHRPVVCRTAVSLNAALCERAFLRSSGEAIPTPAWFSLVRLGYDLALCGAIRKEGLSYVSCELNAALKSTLENGEAERQWLAGENVLAGLQEDPNGDPFRSEVNQQVYAAAFSCRNDSMNCCGVVMPPNTRSGAVYLISRGRRITLNAGLCQSCWRVLS